ncbi:MAG: hypothetical protein DRQ55_12750 [Planctomycetota bacterium]|nr:MAG: hypothetical protein DRQ55_12750 [Planctomycetota bacterium]RKZ10264.1 MAG: hypothetical protein DRQ32_07355 [bacterium]
MYTELHYNAELKHGPPPEVLRVLEHMIGEGTFETFFGDLPDHDLFTSPRWDTMLRGESESFAADTHSTLRLDEVSDTYLLCIRSNFKQTASEIARFIAWLGPYVDASTGDFLGFYRDDDSEVPTLILQPAPAA